MSAKYVYTCDYCTDAVPNGTMLIEVTTRDANGRQDPFRHAHPHHNPATILKSEWTLLATGNIKAVEFRNIIATSA